MSNQPEQSRKRKSSRNVAMGIVSQIIMAAMSFVTRTVLLQYLGLGAVSLNGLFSEVIAMLSLAEMGVGSAIVYHLYKPLANGDHDRVCQLMNLYKQAYRAIAAVVFVVGCALIPIIPRITREIDFTDNYIRIVYFIFVVQTSTSYLFSYKMALLNADQNAYINTLQALIVRIVSVVVQIVLLVCFGNYVVYLCGIVVVGIISNMVRASLVDRRYPYLKGNKQILPKDERKNVFGNIKHIFVQVVSGKITNSTDNILISMMAGTLQVGYFSNYNTVYNILRAVILQAGNGVTGSMGNAFVTENKSYCDVIMRRLTMIFFLAGSISVTAMYSMINPFITMWIGEKYLISKAVVIVTVSLVFIEFLKTPLWKATGLTGLFAKDKNISILGTSVNLVVSILLGLKIGMLGIFIGTVCTYVIQIVLKIRLLYKDFFKRPSREMYILWAKMILCFAASIGLCQLIALAEFPNMFLTFLARGILAVIAAVAVDLAMFGRSAEFAYVMKLAREAIDKIKRKVKKSPEAAITQNGGEQP